MKTRVVPGSELDPAKGLRAEDYMEEPTDFPLTQFRQVINKCYETAKSKGWWDKYGQEAQAARVLGDFKAEVISSKLMLIVSELAEALEEVRSGSPDFYYAMDGSGKPEGLSVELADAVIRIFDLAGWLGIDLAAAIHEKMEFNKTRAHKHGGKSI